MVLDNVITDFQACFRETILKELGAEIEDTVVAMVWAKVQTEVRDRVDKNCDLATIKPLAKAAAKTCACLVIQAGGGTEKELAMANELHEALGSKTKVLEYCEGVGDGERDQQTLDFIYSFILQCLSS